MHEDSNDFPFITEVDEIWLSFSPVEDPVEHIRKFGTAKVSVGEGCWVHPCGNLFEESFPGSVGSRGEFECSCELCQAFRDLAEREETI